MMKVSRWTMLAAALLAGAVVLTRSPAQTRPTAVAATRVAVCDVVGIFNNYQRAKDLTAKLNERRRSIQAENEQRGKEIEAIKMELEGLKKGSREYEKRFKEMQRRTFDRAAWLKYEESLAIREHHRLTREMYTQIQETVATVARRQGFHIVLFRDPEKLTSQNTSELLRQINMRKVLYSDDRVDITEETLRTLNETYKASGG